MSDEDEDADRVRLLLVEDNRELAALRAARFAAEGWSVSVADSAEAARRELGGAPVDLLLVDINLDVGNPSDMSGLEIAREARERWPDVAVCGYSAWFSESELPLVEAMPEVDRLLIKGSLGLSELEQALDEVAELGRRARDRRRAR